MRPWPAKSAALSLICVLLFSISTAWAQTVPDDAVICRQVARDAEQAFNLPPGILQAIGQVETGDWPWSANIDGAARTYTSKQEAVAALSQHRSPAPFNEDIGCFQISSRFHPDAFPSLAEAFDPTANARYAARFLLSLHDRLGDWSRAIAAYHSATQSLGDEYRNRVLAVWKDPPADAGTPVPVSDTVVAAPDPPRPQVIAIGPRLPMSIHVWTLSSVSTDAAPGLPRIISR